MNLNPDFASLYFAISKGFIHEFFFQVRENNQLDQKYFLFNFSPLSVNL